MRIRWTVLAANDFEQIAAYLLENPPQQRCGPLYSR